MIDISIVDQANKIPVGVTDFGELLVASTGAPPNLSQRNVIFRQYMTQDGTPTGTSSMLVNGSVTNVDYYISAQQDSDLYISAVSFVIADAGADLNEFGAIAALTNGCYLFYENQYGVIDINTALKTNWDFIRLCGGVPAFGSGVDCFRASNVFGASEAYIPFLNFINFIPPYGLRFERGTKQRLVLRIRDNVSAIDQFDVICYGQKRY